MTLAPAHTAPATIAPPDVEPPPVLRSRDQEYGPRPEFRDGMTVCRAAWRYWTAGDVIQAALEVDGRTHIVWDRLTDFADGWHPHHLADEVVGALGGRFGLPSPQTQCAAAPAELALWRAASQSPRVDAAARRACLGRESFSSGGDPELLRALAAEPPPAAR